MKGSKFLVGIYFILCSFISGGTLNQKIIQSLTDFNKRFPQEKAYLQFDRDDYAPGQTIWFKGYVTLQDLPTNLSTILYVELINSAGDILNRDILPISDGTAFGDFPLPLTLIPGNYRIRAYTAWMLNFDHEFLFHKDFGVYQTGFTPKGNENLSGSSFFSGTDSIQKEGFSVQFFPEGGDLVIGVQSKVAFKAINSEGFPIEINGKIAGSNGKILGLVQTVHDGMGSFELTPETGVAYTAMVGTRSGAEQSFLLPKALDSGIVLQITPPVDNQKLNFDITRSEKDADRFNNLKMVVQMQNALLQIYDINFSQGLHAGMLRLAKWPSGIMQITVMDTTGLPLAERLVFVRHPDNIPLHLGVNDLDLSPKAKNDLTFSADDSIRGNYSLSVTDPDVESNPPYEDNIISNQLLTSDIKGYVYRPAWYFRNEDSSTLAALDLVMLTNGWRRFSWKKIMNNDFPRIAYPADNAGLVIKGHSMTFTNGKINMIIKDPADTQDYYVSAPVNRDGQFLIPFLHFHDTAQIYFQGASGNEAASGDQFHLDGSFLTYLTQVNLAEPFHISNHFDSGSFHHPGPPANNTPLNPNHKGIQIHEVVVTAKPESSEQLVEDRYVTGQFKEMAYRELDMLDDPPPDENLIDYLRSKLGRISFNLDQNGTYVPVWDNNCSPDIYLNEEPIASWDLQNLNIRDIALIKIFPPPFFTGMGQGNCAGIAIYTKKGNDHSPKGGLGKGQKIGYTLVRQFYSPDYQTNQHLIFPDERRTIFWDPVIIPDSTTHKAEISFYNNLRTKRFRIVAEGMDDSGRFGRLDTIIER